MLVDGSLVVLSLSAGGGVPVADSATAELSWMVREAGAVELADRLEAGSDWDLGHRDGTLSYAGAGACALQSGDGFASCGARRLVGSDVEDLVSVRAAFTSPERDLTP